MDRCPICNKPVGARGKNETFPFCSERCKTIDLGKWLSEDYRVPVENDGDVDEEDRADPAAKRDVRN